MNERPEPDGFDWSLTTWEGNRRAQLELWATMSLDRILEAQEEMADLCERLARQAGRITARAAGRPSGPHLPERGKKAEEADPSRSGPAFPRGFVERLVFEWRGMIGRILSRRK